MCAASYVSFATPDSSTRTLASSRWSSSHCVLTYTDTSASRRIGASGLARDVAQFAGEAIVEPHERPVSLREQLPDTVPHLRPQLDQPSAVARYPRLDAKRRVEPHRTTKPHVEPRRRRPRRCVVHGPPHRLVDQRRDEPAV